MNLIKYFIPLSAISLCFFVSCGDNESNSFSTDITNTESDSGNTPEDISSSSNNVVNSITSSKDSTQTKDTTLSKDSSTTNIPPVIKDSSVVKDSTTSKDSSLTNIPQNNEKYASCAVKLDTLETFYNVSCNDVILGYLYNKDGTKLTELKNEGNNCSLNDYLDGRVDVTCDNTVTTLYKSLCNSVPYDPAANYCSIYILKPVYNTSLPITSSPAFVSCNSNDLWCHNPNTDTESSNNNDKIIYRDNGESGFYFSEAEQTSHDLKDWRGICITYTSEIGIKITLDLGSTKNAELKNNLPQALLGPTSSTIPEERCFNWSSFKQRRWDSPAISGDDASQSIAKFTIERQDATKGKFNLIRLRTVAEELKDPYNPLHCSEMWCAPDGSDGLYTECGTGNIGYWHFQTDKKEGGSSTLNWPVQIGHTYSETSLEPVIATYGALVGSYTLNNGIKNPYVKVGFDLDNQSTQNVDISDWNGLCLVYESDHDFSIELAPYGNSVSTNNPTATIPKSFSRATIDLPWDSFSQSSGSSTVHDINFIFSGAPNTNGLFAFYTVGKLGTCK